MASPETKAPAEYRSSGPIRFNVFYEGVEAQSLMRQLQLAARALRSAAAVQARASDAVELREAAARLARLGGVSDAVPVDHGDHGLRADGPNSMAEMGMGAAAARPPDHGPLGVQLPEILGLVGLAENAAASNRVIASLVGSAVAECIGKCGDRTSPLARAPEQLREIARCLEESGRAAERERLQVVEVLDRICDQATRPSKAPVHIKPRPSPLVRVGPGGSFVTDIYG